jgi:hypothetical protein
MLQRRVIPELLDQLPADDPEALRSRQDLRRINGLMGNEHWILRSLARFSEAAESGIVEMGAGDGRLSEKLARDYANARVTAYDLAPRPAGLDPRVCWEMGDFLGLARTFWRFEETCTWRGARRVIGWRD